MMPGEIFRRQSNIERNFRLVIAKPIDATSLINILKSIQMTCFISNFISKDDGVSVTRLVIQIAQ